MRRAAGGTLARLVHAGLVAKHGQRGAALYRLTRAGEAFVAEYERKMREREDGDDPGALLLEPSDWGAVEAALPEAYRP